MAQIIREIRVDVSQPNVFQAIVAKQLDCNSRFLKITLVDFGVKIEVPKTAKVTINANRPDGKSQSFVGVANNDGTITVPLAQWMLEVAGELKCDVSVINTTDNKRLTSTDFYVNVQEAANKSTDISENPDGEIRVITPTQKIDENSSDDEYPSAKAVYELDNITATASGNAITIDSAKAPLQQLKLYGKTTQNGTPTPDAPVPLVSVGDSGSFSVGLYGKNLFDIGTDTSEYFSTNNHGGNITTSKGNVSTNIDMSFNDNSIVIENYVLTGYAWFSKFIELTPNTIYTYSASSNCGGARMYGANSNSIGTIGNELFSAGSGSIEKTFNSGNYKYYWISFYPAEVGKILSNVQIELDTKATPYEPYKEKQTLTMPYELRSVGDIKDEVDFNRGVHTKEFDLYQMPTSGYTLSAVRDTYVEFTCIKTISNVNNGAFSKSTHFAQTETSRIAYASGTLYIRFPIDTGITTTEQANEFFSNNTVYALYKLTTPIETPLTESELNAYRQLHTNKPNTTILSEADMEVDYYINKPNAQAIGNIHSQVNKDYLKLQQAIISTGGSTL